MPNVRRGVLGVALRVVVSKSKHTVIAYGAGGKELAQYPKLLGNVDKNLGSQQSGRRSVARPCSLSGGLVSLASVGQL